MEIQKNSESQGPMLIKTTLAPTVRPSHFLKIQVNDKDRLVEAINQIKGIKTRKPEFVLRIQSSISKESRSVSWVLRSSGRRKSIVAYLFHKWLFSELTKQERIIFFELREVTLDNQIYSALRASNLGYSRSHIRDTLKGLSFLLWKKKPPTIESWKGYRTFYLSIEREERHRTEMIVPKYTGWRRHQNDQGSLVPQKEEPFYSEPLIENDTLSIFLESLKEMKEKSNVRHTVIINNIKVTYESRIS